MQLLDVVAAGSHYIHQWPSAREEVYAHWIDYRALTADGQHVVRIGFGTRPVYGSPRKRVVVWIDRKPHAAFIGADDFDHSGDVLSLIKVPGQSGKRICRYPDEPVPERYSGLPVVGLRNRIAGQGVRNAWVVVANVADHRLMAALAALRRIENSR